MKEALYINYNGEFFNEDEAIFTVKNRAFRYGDALFETIRVINGKPCFMEDHFNRLEKGMEILKMKSSVNLFDELKKQIIALIKKNNITKGGRIRLTIFRTGEGFYTPEKEGRSYVIEATSINHNEYTLNERGLNVDVYNDFKRCRTDLSKIKTANNIPQVLAGIYKKENNLDDCLILNDQGRIVEAISSNVFLYKNNNIYTSAIEEGCVEGVMRKQIIEISKIMGINIFEGMLTGGMLLQADEMFLTNAINGIQWVSSYRTKRYSNNSIKEILEQLNKFYKAA